MIQPERLAAVFTELCEIDSPSREEGRIAARLREIFADLGADAIVEDDSATVTGSQCGNLIIRFAGKGEGRPLFFSCHMDTVQPAQGIQVLRVGDLFTSAGDTVLGSDDKSGIAACIEAMRVCADQGLAHRPVEFIITTCEEIGLLGAKALDPTQLRAREGYALDSTGFGKVITHAPALNHLHIVIHGVAAHAGLNPEWGVSAIQIAVEALSRAPSGRIDAESTANFGVIKGGVAANIVADKVVLEGELRSHSSEKLAQLTEAVHEAFFGAVQNWQDPQKLAKGRPEVEIVVTPEFPAMALAADELVIRQVEAAAQSIGLQLSYEQAGGGSDANIFNGYGLATAILATGMTHVHSTQEQVELQDMVKLTRLILALLTGRAC